MPPNPRNDESSADHYLRSILFLTKKVRRLVAPLKYQLVSSIDEQNSIADKFISDVMVCISLEQLGGVKE